MGTLRDLQFALQLKVEELRQRDTLIDELELELDTKDELIRRLQGELDRHRATISPPGPTTGCSAQGEEREQRKTIISEPFTVEHKTLEAISHTSCDKSPEAQKRIQASFLKSVFLKNLDDGQTRALLDCIHSTTVSQGCCVIQEGSIGIEAYVLDDGKLEMTKDGQKPLTIEPGNIFGELALLYNCTYLYNVSALTDCKLWVIDRRTFQTVLMQTCLSSLSHSMKLLSSVPFLQALPDDVIMSMSDVMEETHYIESDYIIRQGATGDTFYVICEGQVKVTEKKEGFEEPVILCRLSEGQWFGEKALWGHDVRTVNVIATGDVTCLVIDREAFKNIIGVLADDGNNDMQLSNNRSNENATLLSNTTLSDFQIISKLGEDELGHVDLVQLKSNSKCSFAMRVLSKRLIVTNHQQEHILRARDILTEAYCPFIVRLHQTFRDAKHLYMLTEACVGGDLWSLLKERGSFDDCSARFYTACVVEALIFLHHCGIIYRDLKPENVFMDQHGYAKLMGPGCSKKIIVGKKTWTFCGTPGYMAPEVILNKGHSISTDLWSLGIFMFELLTGSLPFSGSDPMMIFAATIRGIDQVNFPKAISKSASSLIKKLCRSNPSERLGSQRNGAKDIQKHKWFEGFNWEGLCNGTLNPPVIPKFNHSVERGTPPSHYTEDVEGLPEVETNWDKDF